MGDEVLPTPEMPSVCPPPLEGDYGLDEIVAHVESLRESCNDLDHRLWSVEDRVARLVETVEKIAEAFTTDDLEEIYGRTDTIGDALANLTTRIRRLSISEQTRA